MKYSIVNYSQIDLGDRIDSEYFQTEYLRVIEDLVRNGAKPLKDYCSLTGSAFYPAAAHLYEIGDMPFIRCVDCISHPVITTRQDPLFEKIPTHFADAHESVKRLSRGEIVITKVGSPCYASIIHDIDEVALSRTVLGLKSITDIDPYYLVAFLRSKYGFTQLLRERELTIQLQLTLNRVGSVLVFKPSRQSLERLVSQCLFQHENINRQSDRLYAQAETLLLSELGLADWQPEHRLTFEVDYLGTRRTSRIDADYFQPKYREIVDAIKGYPGGWDTLGNLTTITKGFEVGSGEYLDEGIPFVRVSNLSPFEITEEKYISEELYREIQELQPQQGEIFLSKDATPGIAHYLREQPQKMITSGGILRLKSKTDKVGNEYLTLVLNSLLTKEQVNRDVGGSVILHWRPDQVAGTMIPIAPKETQAQIQDKVTESAALRQESKRLLQCAKRAVEMAIEEDEQTAIAWLEKETSAATTTPD